MKLNVLKDNVRGKKIVMIDDSIVRGTTSGKIVKMLKEAGAAEVHVRISSPPVVHSCHFGIDTPSKKNLVAANHSLKDIKKMLGADSLGYLSVEGLWSAIGISGSHICSACFNGEYPMDVPKTGDKFVFEKE